MLQVLFPLHLAAGAEQRSLDACEVIRDRRAPTAARRWRARCPAARSAPWCGAPPPHARPDERGRVVDRYALSFPSRTGSEAAVAEVMSNHRGPDPVGVRGPGLFRFGEVRPHVSACGPDTWREPRDAVARELSRRERRAHRRPR